MSWDVAADGETATGPEYLVTAGDELVGTLTPIWSDEDGVRVSLLPEVDLDDLSAAQALALAEALREAAMVHPPTGGSLPPS